MNIEQLKYPVGRFQRPNVIDATQLEEWIDDLAALPQQMRTLVENLNETELHYKYRPEGWTIQQVVHHLADSHINSLIRFKLALTQDNPTISPYLEDKWALLPDTLDAPIEVSLKILDGVHYRLVKVLRGMELADFERTFFHPEHKKSFRLDVNTGIYAWHSRHHLAHIKQALEHQFD